MAWNVFYLDEFTEWLVDQDEGLQDEVTASVVVLEQYGPALGRPRVDTLYDSNLPNLKELRVQFRGQPYRILFIFDPKRNAVLLLGGNKKGDDRWYKRNIPLAERRYLLYLEALKEAENEDH